MCYMCQKARYGYHITRQSNLASIRGAGLKCLKLRTGSWSAADDGSFAADRAARLPAKIQEALRKGAWECLKTGLTADQIVNAPHPGLMTLIDVALTGSVDDNTAVDDDFTRSIGMYCGMFTPAKARKVPLPEARALAARLADRTDHYLVRLAESYVDWRNLVEEKITGSHVYFFARNHKSKYEQYLKFNGGAASAVVLRVNLSSLHGHEPDQSDGDAIMTGNVVLPTQLEWCEAGPHFQGGTGNTEMGGAEIKLWEATGTWQAL